MKTVELAVTARGKMTKNELYRSRKAGTVPAILYGRHLAENITLSFSDKEFGKIYEKVGKVALYMFKSGESNLNGKAAMIKEMQRDCISGSLLHVDMLEINMNEKIHVKVPVEFKGTPIGAKEGGILEVQTREVMVECLPADMPEDIVVDISHLKVNEGLHVSDIHLGDNIKILSDAETALCSVHIVEEVVVEAAPLPTEVEVIGAKGKEAEGEEGAAAAASGDAKAAAPAAAKADAAKPAADAKAAKGGDAKGKGDAKK